MQTNRSSHAQTRTQQIDAGLRDHMNSVYNRMSLGILITAITAWAVSSIPELFALLMGGPQAYIFMLAPLAIIWFGFNPRTMSSSTLKMVFVGLSVVYGISFSVIGLAFAGADIARAFFVTSAMFAGLSIFGYTTKKDLSALGTFCMMGLLGLIVLSIIGFFVPFSSGMEMMISIGIIAVISGLTAWETQSAKAMYHAGNDKEINSRMAWASALSLYINFIIMFTHVLNLMQER